MTKLFLIAALATLLVAGCKPIAQDSPSKANAPSEAAAADNDSASAEVSLKMLDYDGIQDLIKGQRGKVVVMDCWSTSCPPCIREFPNLVALSKKYPSDDLAAISLSFDYEGIGKPEDRQELVLKFLKDQGATFNNVLSSDEADVLYKTMDLAAIPAVYVYDRSGELRKRFEIEGSGEFTYEDVGKLVAELVEEKAGENAANEAAAPDTGAAQEKESAGTSQP